MLLLLFLLLFAAVNFVHTTLVIFFSEKKITFTFKWYQSYINSRLNLVFIKSFRKFSREFSVFIDLNVYLNGYGKSVYRKWWSFAKHYATAFDSNITIVNLIVILSGWIWTSLDSYVSEFFVSVNFSFWNFFTFSFTVL